MGVAAGDPSSRRLYFIDWLRVVLTINVVVMHSMLTYTSDDGAGMWSGQMDDAGSEPVLNAFFWFFTLGGWAFRMMLFFLLAGYFTRRSYHRKGAAKFMWDRTLRLLVPAILYSCLVQPFLYWISNSSDSAVASAYEEEVAEYADFYTDAQGNVNVPPPHTMGLGEWYQAYFTTPGLFGFDGPVWFVYNLWWFTVGYVLLMLIMDSALFQKILRALTSISNCIMLGHKASMQQKQQLHVANKSDSVIVQFSIANSGGISEGSSPPATVIIDPETPAAGVAAIQDSTAAAATAGSQAAPAACSKGAVDTTKLTEPFPLHSVLLGGVYLILALWAAQFCVRLIMYFAAAASGDETADFYSTVSYYLISFEPAFIPQYIAAFTLGVLAQKHNGLLRLPRELGFWCVCSSAVFYVIAWAVLWMFEDLRKAEYWGQLPPNAPQLLYVLAYGFVEMSFGTVWGIGWLVVFREVFNSKLRRFGAILIGAAYGVYLIHPIFITLYGRMLEHAAFPTFIVNSIIIAYLTVPSAWLVASLLKRVPGASRIL